MKSLNTTQELWTNEDIEILENREEYGCFCFSICFSLCFCFI